MTEKETGNAQPGACVDVLPRCLAYCALLEHVRQHREGNFQPKHENEKMASFVDADKIELITQAKQKVKK